VVRIPDTPTCNTCGGVTVSSPTQAAGRPSCGCNSGYKVAQPQQLQVQRFSQNMALPAQPMYGSGAQFSNTAAPTGWTSSAYNNFFARTN
jgi:hypothetical protein